jgi:hypothetical protein
MTWGEISKWAKSHGFKLSRKDDLFLWSKIEDPEVNGSEKSLKDASIAIFNCFTNNKWVSYQKDYKNRN